MSAAKQHKDSEIYSEIIIDLYKNPLNFGRLERPSLTLQGGNPLCGDEVQFELNIEDGIIKDIRFTGHGCAISRAAESLLTEMIKGKKFEEVNKISDSDIFDVLGNVVQTRVKCALLGIYVLRQGFGKYSRKPNTKLISGLGV